MDLKEDLEYFELKFHFDSCEACAESFRVPNNFKSEDYILEIPNFAPAVIDF